MYCTSNIVYYGFSVSSSNDFLRKEPIFPSIMHTPFTGALTIKKIKTEIKKNIQYNRTIHIKLNEKEKLF